MEKYEISEQEIAALLSSRLSDPPAEEEGGDGTPTAELKATSPQQSIGQSEESQQRDNVQLPESANVNLSHNKSEQIDESYQIEGDNYEDEVISSGTAPPLNPAIIPPQNHTTKDKAPLPQNMRQFDPNHFVFFKPPPRTLSQLPQGSRMFIGNISRDRTTEAEVAEVFAKYGNIYEISLRGSYGFVQFDTVEACNEAIRHESGNMLGGLTFDCKVSRDRNTMRKNAQLAQAAQQNQQSLSNKGGNSYKPVQKQKGGQGAVRNSRRDSFDHRQPHGRRDRDRSYSYSRSRSRSRSFSPPSRYQDSFEFPLPRRYGNSVPEVQILVLDNVDRNYVSMIEDSLKRAGFDTDNILLSARLPLKAVIKQMVTEGVKAVILLERFYERDQMMCMQIILPNGAIQEYENISIDQAIKVLVKEKSSRHNRNAPSVSSLAPPTMQANTNPLQTVLAQLIASNADPKTLMLVANAMQQQQQPQQQQPLPPYNPPPAMLPQFYPNVPAAPINTSVQNQMPMGYQQTNPMLSALGIQAPQQQAFSAPPMPPQQLPQEPALNVTDILNKLKGLRGQSW